MGFNPLDGSFDQLASIPGTPKVSIGMPVYNGAPYLHKALDSLLAQTFRDFELIISDNASTDRTPEICREYAAQDARIRYIRQTENQGMIWNFNFVLEQSRAKYFMWAAADDRWERNYINNLYWRLKENKNTVIAFSGLDVIYANDIEEKAVLINRYIGSIASDHLINRLENFILFPDQLGKVNLIYGLMRRKVLQQGWKLTIGGVAWPRNVWGEDALLVFKIMTMGNLSFEPKILFHKYNYISPVINKYNLTNIDVLFNLIKSTIIYFPNIKLYLNTYKYLIDNIEELTIVEKNYLKKLIIRRVRYLYLYYISLTLKNIIKKLLGLGRLISEMD
jgi:glycosyltransferase involved in cell wall biosynthesis